MEHKTQTTHVHALLCNVTVTVQQLAIKRNLQRVQAIAAILHSISLSICVTEWSTGAWQRVSSTGADATEAAYCRQGNLLLHILFPPASPPAVTRKLWKELPRIRPLSHRHHYAVIAMAKWLAKCCKHFEDSALETRLIQGSRISIVSLIFCQLCPVAPFSDDMWTVSGQQYHDKQ